MNLSAAADQIAAHAIAMEKCALDVMLPAVKCSIVLKARSVRSITAAEPRTDINHAVSATSYLVRSFLVPEIRT